VPDFEMTPMKTAVLAVKEHGSHGCHDLRRVCRSLRDSPLPAVATGVLLHSSIARATTRAIARLPRVNGPGIRARNLQSGLACLNT
jgi:hypothetical protein